MLDSSLISWWDSETRNWQIQLWPDQMSHITATVHAVTNFTLNRVIITGGLSGIQYNFINPDESLCLIGYFHYVWKRLVMEFDPTFFLFELLEILKKCRNVYRLQISFMLWCLLILLSICWRASYTKDWRTCRFCQPSQWTVLLKRQLLCCWWPMRSLFDLKGSQRDAINATSLMVDKFELWYCKNLWVPFTYRNTIKYFLCMDSKDSVMDQNTLY